MLDIGLEIIKSLGITIGFSGNLGQIPIHDAFDDSFDLSDHGTVEPYPSRDVQQHAKLPVDIHMGDITNLVTHNCVNMAQQCSNTDSHADCEDGIHNNTVSPTNCTKITEVGRDSASVHNTIFVVTVVQGSIHDTNQIVHSNPEKFRRSSASSDNTVADNKAHPMGDNVLRNNSCNTQGTPADKQSPINNYLDTDTDDSHDPAEDKVRITDKTPESIENIHHDKNQDNMADIGDAPGSLTGNNARTELPPHVVGPIIPGKDESGNREPCTVIIVMTDPTSHPQQKPHDSVVVQSRVKDLLQHKQPKEGCVQPHSLVSVTAEQNSEQLPVASLSFTHIIDQGRHHMYPLNIHDTHVTLCVAGLANKDCLLVAPERPVLEVHCQTVFVHPEIHSKKQNALDDWPKNTHDETCCDTAPDQGHRHGFMSNTGEHNGVVENHLTHHACCVPYNSDIRKNTVDMPQFNVVVYSVSRQVASDKPVISVDQFIAS